METLDQLNEGVASTALRAAAKLKDGKNGYVVPNTLAIWIHPGIGYVAPLEKRITWKPRTGKWIRSAVIKEEEYGSKGS